MTAVRRQGGHLATRRWYYLVPASGEPRGLVHAIERNTLAHLPGATERYAGRDELEAGLKRLVTGVRRVAMEYSPKCAIPYVARVDAGTIELVRQLGVDVVSSGDLVQRFASTWSAAAIDTHRVASTKLYKIKDRAFDAIGRRTHDAVTTTEYDVQQLMAGWFREEGLVSDSDPVVSAAENAGNPHYFPDAGPTHHVAAVYLSGTMEPDAWVDISDTLDIKVEALFRHTSQLTETGEFFRAFLRERAEEAGRAAGVRYAEGFRRLTLLA